MANRRIPPQETLSATIALGERKPLREAFNKFANATAAAGRIPIPSGASNSANAKDA